MVRFVSPEVSELSYEQREAVLVKNIYYWPQLQLIIWNVYMIISGLYLITDYSKFLVQQGRLGLGTPWIMPYGITVGALTELVAWGMLLMALRRRLLPGHVIVLAFVLLVLYLTGLIGSGIQLFGPVLHACQVSVNDNDAQGISIDTLVWLLQKDICNDWDVVFAFWCAGTVLQIWWLYMARSVVVSGNK